MTHEQLIDYISLLADTLMTQMLTLKDNNFQIINMLRELEKNL